MNGVFVLVALIIANANAGLIGAPLAAPVATSIVGTRTISLATPAIAAAPIGLTTPLIGKSLIAGPAIASPLAVGLGTPLWGKSLLAAPAISTVAVGPALAAGPILRAW